MDALPGSDALLVPGSAPASSLAARLALHALVFQSARAVAVLWVRWAHPQTAHFFSFDCKLNDLIGRLAGL